MLSPTRGASWIARASVLGAVLVCLTWGGHSIAGGHGSFAGLFFVSILMVAVALCATKQELTYRILFGYLLASQLASHLIMSGFVGHVGSVSTGSATEAHRHHDVLTALSSTSVSTDSPASANVGGGGDSTLVMVACHVLVCAIAAVALREGERVMFSLHRAIPQILRVLLGLVVSGPRPVMPSTTTRPPLFQLDSRRAPEFRPLREIYRRGPPIPAV